MFKRIAAILVLSMSISAYAAEIPVDAKLDYNQGIDFYKLGMYERAIESFRSATRTYPDYIDVYYNLGYAYNKLGQYSNAYEVLSDPKKMNFKNEEDLLNQIVPYKDGIIIKDGIYQAVYLPSVWEELPDKELFLKSLKIKAGLPQNHFSKTFEAFRFYTEYISQKE